MALRLITPATTLPLDLAEVKAHLRVQHDADDALLTQFTKTAAQWVEEETGKTLLTKEWEYSNRNGILTLPHPPVQEVVEVKVGSRVLRDCDYEIKTQGLATMISVAADGWRAPKVTVRYRAGFGDSPEDIPHSLHQVLLSTVAHLYEVRVGEPKGTSFFASHVLPWIQHHRSYALA